MDHALFKDKNGPITELSWGRFVIEGQEHAEGPEERIGKGKDIRVIGTDVTRWKERRGHTLKKEMVTGVYDKGIDILIIGTGVAGALDVPQSVIKEIANHGIKRLYIEKTPEACREYNRLFHKKERVAMLAHGTC